MLLMFELVALIALISSIVIFAFIDDLNMLSFILSLVSMAITGWTLFNWMDAHTKAYLYDDLLLGRYCQATGQVTVYLLMFHIILTLFTFGRYLNSH